MAIDLRHPPPPPAPGQSPAEFCGNFSIRRAKGSNILDAYGFNISGFGSVVSGMLLNRPVIDKTGVTGTFDIQEFAPDVTMPSIGIPLGNETIRAQYRPITYGSRSSLLCRSSSA